MSSPEIQLLIDKGKIVNEILIQMILFYVLNSIVSDFIEIKSETVKQVIIKSLLLT